MATLEELQEISKRGLRDRLPESDRQIFDEMVRRGMIDVQGAAPSSGQPPSGVPVDQERVPAPFTQPVAGVAELTPAQVAEQMSRGIGRRVTGAVEGAASILSSGGAEIAAGLTGLTSLPFGTVEQAKRNMAQVREDLTFVPRSQAAQESVGKIGQALEPVATKIAAAEKFVEDKVLQATGSEGLALAAKIIPALGLEALSFVGVKIPRKVGKTVKEGQVKKAADAELADAAPSSDDLRAASGKIYDELKTMGVSVNPNSYLGLATDIFKKADDLGLDPIITPKSVATIKRLDELVENPNVSLSQLDRLRKIAQGAAGDVINKTDANIGRVIVETIDDFVDNAGPGAFTKTTPGPVTPQIAAMQRTARQMWGRARRSERIQKAMDLAKEHASGFENGIRIRLREILNRPKERKFFNAEEIAEIQKVVRGTKGANLFKLLGKVGFKEGAQTNSLGTIAGMAIGAKLGGGVGIVAMPVIGQMSKTIAQKLTKGNAEFADAVVRAGKNGRQIAAAYVRNVPKKDRSIGELAELLARREASLDNLQSTEFVQSAARETRAALAEATAITSVLTGQANQEP